jgi:thiol-disulfide isomerase/thioredoxin
MLLLTASLIFSGCEKQQIDTNESCENNATKIVKKEIFKLQDKNRTIYIKTQGENFEVNGTKKVALISFFTSYCPSCKAEIREFEKIQRRDKNIDIIGIELDGNFIDKDFFISKDLETNHKLAKKIYNILHAPASMPIPLTILIKDGKYVIHYIGAVPIEMIQSDIKNSLGE